MSAIRETDRWTTIVRGPLAVAALSVLLEVLSQSGFSIPNVEAFLILLVAYVAFVDGIGAGVASALLATAYYGYSVSPKASSFHVAVHEWEPVLIVGIAMPILAVIVGALRRELERANAREREARHQLDAVLENMHAGFYTVDREGRLTYLNSRAEKLLGIPREDALGRHLHAWHHDLPGALKPERLLQTIDLQVSGSHEWHDEERGCWFDIQIHPFAEGAAVYFTDVTERKALQDRAQGAAKMEALGRLAGGIAHDFNNLLTAIRGFNDLVLSDLPPNDAHRSSLEEVARAADRAGRLTKQLLAYTRRQVLQPRLLRLNDEIEAMTEMLRRIVREDVAIVTEFADDVFPIQVDAGQFEQIVLNLVVNASDAMPNGGRVLLCTSRKSLEAPQPCDRFTIGAGDYAVLTVKDVGVGMDEETAARIFEPFFTTKDRATGTGLGLATVYGIVKQSGGYITVESEPGAGSSFHIWLPRATGDEAEIEEEASSAGDAPRGASVLVVEDDDAVRTLACRILRQEGLHVLEARDALDALSQAERLDYPVDLLFTDIVMPAMSGRELARRLAVRWPDLKVLYTSGYTNETLIQDGIARGVLDPETAFLHKPYIASELIARVTDFVGEAVAA
jgi:PAS domain S-box-containing protein